ncbi:hypothetical protein E5676_scaffold322G00440 [Cucumis melo var. makuwa]|uniref:Uncharacterized protein n=2 Tax=Cucumis melo TaxID=3656 RepID=A0A5A7TC25_CUCMM|nr:hypothetical protein E6C27_scaffold121G00300 [Cucumis melo var. makuwa]TYK26975.1 hypothetical protein E5676_scaffold322G00440 [Cucumis melo var. makuwa]
MAGNGGTPQGPLQGHSEKVMQRLETLINVKLDILEQRFQAKERPEVRRQVVGNLDVEEDSEQNESNSNPSIDGPRA